MKFFNPMFVFMLAVFSAPVVAGCAKCSVDFVCLAKAADCKPGARCEVHDDDCGNWESLPDRFPEPRSKLNPAPMLESAQNQPTQICVPGVKGPVIEPSGAMAAFKAAEGNWLLTTALIRFEELAATGVLDSGAFSFGTAETLAQQEAALAGQELSIPEVPFTGFNGFAEYRTYPADKITSPDLMTLDTELHIWRTHRAKLVPTHGLIAYAHFRKDAKTGLWSRKAVTVKYVMPTPSKGIFGNFDDHKEIVAEFIKNRQQTALSSTAK